MRTSVRAIGVLFALSMTAVMWDTTAAAQSARVKVDMNAPAPRLPNGKPDFSGVWARPGVQDRERREGGRDRGRDHLVARPDPTRTEREVQRVGAVGDRDGLARAERLRQLALERLALGTEHEPARVEDARERRVELGTQLRHAGAEIDEGYARAHR